MSFKVLMIILDGFSSKYLRKDLCPNMFEVSKIDFWRIKPMFGFQAIGAAIYSGATPNTTKVLSEFILEENEMMHSSFIRALFELTDRLPTDDLCITARNLLYKITRKKGRGISNLIPPYLLGYFSPKLKGEFTNKGILGNIPTIFDILRENGMTYEIQRPSLTSEFFMYNKVISDLKKEKIPDFLVLHPCSLDIVGHKFGPNSSQIRSLIKKVDEQISRIIHYIKFSSEKIVLIILSDHGMCPVKGYVNLYNLLRDLPLKLGKDYLIFLDSTMARFWFFNNKSRNLIYSKLTNVEFGQILNEAAKKKLEIDKIGREYGEMIFAINEGYVFFPDFFRKHNPPRGMHGYAFSRYDSPILLMYTSHLSEIPKKEKTIRFIDVMPTILNLLDLPIPVTCEGKSIFK